MNGSLFFIIYAGAIALVSFQGIAAWRDGYLTQTRMRARGITNGWSLVEHGGMWADVTIIPLIVGYYASTHELALLSQGSFRILEIAIAIVWVAGYMYQEAGKVTPEAHTHDGKTTFAGWIHGFFAVIVLWILGLVYFGLTTPPVSTSELLWTSVVLTCFMDMATRKFSKHWKYDVPAIRQVLIGIVGLWIITFIRIHYS